MRREKSGEGEYYHVYNRGVDKRRIFNGLRDYQRLLLSMFLFCSEASFPNLARFHSFVQHSMLRSAVKEIEQITQHEPKLTTIVCFCFMPNHFHFLLKEEVAGGISKYMQRLGNSYTKYFNTKVERRGHLFGSSFHSIHVDRNEYLLYLSRYIHRNPEGLSLKTRALIDYQWSSYQDFVKENRWGKMINPSIILDQFANPKEYQQYVESEIDEEIDPRYLLGE